MKFWEDISLKAIVGLGVAISVTIHFSAALFGLYQQQIGLEQQDLTLKRIEAIVSQARENERLLMDVRELSRVVVAVTDCKPQDAGETCQEKLRKRSIAEGRERLKAVRCIVDSVTDGDPPTRTEQECIP